MAGRKRTSINRRITIAAPENAATDLITDKVIFTDAGGRPIQRFDPEQLSGLPADLRGLMVQAFREHGVSQGRRLAERPGERSSALPATSSTMGRSREPAMSIPPRSAATCSGSGHRRPPARCAVRTPRRLMCFGRCYCGASAIDQAHSHATLRFPGIRFPEGERISNRVGGCRPIRSRRSSAPATRRSMRPGPGFSMGGMSSGAPSFRPRSCAVRDSIDGYGGSAASRTVACPTGLFSKNTGSSPPRS